MSRGKPVERATLEGLVNEGLSTREIAIRLECCQATVRHWLKKHDVQTRTSERQRLAREAVASGVLDVQADCRRHGLAPHRVRPGRADSFACGAGLKLCRVADARSSEFLSRRLAAPAAFAAIHALSSRSSFTTSIQPPRTSASRMRVSRDPLSAPAKRRESACCSAPTATRRWRPA
jgi:hypothetical protein